MSLLMVMRMGQEQVMVSGILTTNGKMLVVLQLFRILFGGYLIGFDLYYYNDLESAFTVMLIYVVIGVLTAFLFWDRERTGLLGLVVLSVALLALETVYMVVYYSQAVPDPSLHNPMANVVSTVCNFAFPLLTLWLAGMVLRESRD